MKVIISTVFIVLLVSIAQAGIFTTSPVSSTVWKAETQQTITWINSKNPPLEQLKSVTIQLMTGPEEQQIPVLTIGQGIQGIAKKFVFKGVPKNLGPSGQFYFLKYSDGDYSGFSARFTIDGIDGTIPGFDPNNPNATANNTTAGNSTSTDPNSGSYGNNSTTGGSSGGSTGGSSGGGSTTTNNSTKPTSTSSTNKPSSTGKSSANSLGAVHVATFVIALVGMIISNWIGYDFSG
ncbi:7839_t:CDS:2 [Paraglomus occultum]|uniref:7839_t:CDS:1 n=1 Tax=Paraglomus occultum TaxID=144539 RepID=A0A9N9C4S0_9GLOM|nr:7839_t:CDS:2 [Paraglomus occultum]